MDLRSHGTVAKPFTLKNFLNESMFLCRANHEYSGDFIYRKPRANAHQGE